MLTDRSAQARQHLDDVVVIDEGIRHLNEHPDNFGLPGHASHHPEGAAGPGEGAHRSLSLCAMISLATSASGRSWLKAYARSLMSASLTLMPSWIDTIPAALWTREVEVGARLEFRCNSVGGRARLRVPAPTWRQCLLLPARRRAGRE